MTAEDLHACSGCGRPTVRYRGTVHGFTCDACMSTRIGLDRGPTRHQRRSSYFIESHRHEVSGGQ